MRLDGAGLAQLAEQAGQMAALREICAGQTTYFVSSAELEEKSIFADFPPTPCSVCEAHMRRVKGKWTCVDQSCAMYGKEQKPR